jgi:2-iminobutanoate/2-iminopropanoate deaminase
VSIGDSTPMMADMTKWAAFSGIHISYFSGSNPARSAFGCSGLALGAHIELECIAAIDR